MNNAREALTSISVRELLTLLYSTDPSMARPIEFALDALADQSKSQQPGDYLFHPRLASITGDRRHDA